jgi:hypothetical protein
MRKTSKVFGRFTTTCAFLNDLDLEYNRISKPFLKALGENENVDV